jgi:hypothetical protein
MEQIKFEKELKEIELIREKKVHKMKKLMKEKKNQNQEKDLKRKTEEHELEDSDSDEDCPIYLIDDFTRMHWKQKVFERREKERIQSEELEKD